MGNLNKVAILGAGAMGSEIGLCFAAAGCKVILKEPELEWADRGKARLKKVIDHSIEKGRFSADLRTKTLERLVPAANYDLFEDVDLVIEAVFEKLEVKKTVLAEADKHCKPSCIFASNTSSIPITLLATSVEESRRPLFVGAHFFAPAFIMKLVEVIPGLETSHETTAFVTKACHLIGKNPVQVKDTAGFVVNRLLFALFNEAVRLADEGIASCEDIDKACQMGLGHPLGPFALMDMADLRMALEIGDILKENYGERFRFGTALRQKVHGGHLGRKTGQGWHVYV
ncbi:3-hydroxyacyl-CoA dehydrogenase family protein [Desulfocicer niacini]